MESLIVNKETCKKCGTCAGVCPGGIILYREGKYPRMMPGADEYCVRCGHCIAACPTGSLTHRDMPLEQCFPLDASHQVTADQCAQLIRNRRSIRAYQDKPVSREDIAWIIDVARFAPTGHNEQGVKWLVFDDREKIRSLSRIGADWLRQMVQSSPDFAAMFEGVLKRQEAGIDDFLRDAPVVVAAYAGKENLMASVDCTIALSYFDLAANSIGLGCCWAGFFMIAVANFPAMKEAVALPEGHKMYGSLMVGYPKYKYQRIPVRRSPDIVWR